MEDISAAESKPFRKSALGLAWEIGCRVVSEVKRCRGGGELIREIFLLRFSTLKS